MTTTYADLYLRKSEADADDALEGHEADCRALAASLGVEIRHVYREIVSATKAVRRDGFEALLADPPKVIICWHQDRLIRTIRDLERVIDTGAAVHSVQAAALDLATPTGRAVARTVTAWSQFEGEHRRARQESSMAKARTEGRWAGGRRCMGYERGMVAFREDEAQAIRDAYAWLLDGVGPAEIARRWNERGLRTTQTEQEWKASWIVPILSNPTYAALRTHHGKIVGDAVWEALVERADWERAQGILGHPNRRINKRAKHTSLLAAIATCGRCGGLMHAGGNTARGGLYACSARWDVSVKRGAIDDYVRSEVAGMLTWVGAHAEEMVAAFPTGSKAVSAPQAASGLVGELRDLEGQLDALAADLTMSVRVLAGRTTAIERRMSEIRELIAEGEAAPPPNPLRAVLEELIPAGEDGDHGAAFLRANLTMQRKVLTALVRIELHPPGAGSRNFKRETVVIEGFGYDRELDDPS